ncbi:MAG: alpha/beta hydrolase [Gemmatimonadota bacterium]
MIIAPSDTVLARGATLQFQLFIRRPGDAANTRIAADSFTASGGEISNAGLFTADEEGAFTVTATIHEPGCPATATASVLVRRNVRYARRSRPRAAARGTTSVQEELNAIQPPTQSEFETAMLARDSAEYVLIDVQFGTNRTVIGDGAPNDFFGPDRSTLSVGTARVSIPVARHRPGNLERPGRFLWIRKREDPRNHVVLQHVTVASLDQWKASLQQGGAERIFVYVHGYSNRFDAAARKAAQLSYDLGIEDGVTAMFSWPSQGTPQGYPADEPAVEASIPAFRDFLRAMRDARPNALIDVICHSMGSRLVSAVLREFARDSADVRLVNVVYAAADIDAQVFREQVLPEIRGAASRVTLYASANDRALSLSRQFHAGWRAGLSGDSLLVADGLDTIDASRLDTDWLGHGYFAESKQVIDDLFMLVRRNLAPDERNLRAANRGERRYWLFP